MKQLILIALVGLILLSGCLDPFGMNTIPRQCIQTGGKLLILDYEIVPGAIELKIKNANFDEIKIQKFVGDPLPLTWENKENATLKKSEEKWFILHADFTTEIEEEIKIIYISDGKTKEESTACYGNRIDDRRLSN